MRVARMFGKRAAVAAAGGLALFGGLAMMAPSAMAADGGGSTATAEIRSVEGSRSAEAPSKKTPKDGDVQRCEVVEEHEDYLMVRCEGEDGEVHVIVVPTDEVDETLPTVPADPADPTEPAEPSQPAEPAKPKS